MATILLIWELGGGLGHVLPLRAIGKAMVQRGHHVIAALRKTAIAKDFLADTGISLIQGPVYTNPPRRIYPRVGGFAQMLANLGFGEATRLNWYFGQWNSLFDSIKPDLAITDHSPWALLALRGRSIPIANVGLGFCCPPDSFPLPFWIPRGFLPPHIQMEQDERALLDTANRLLQHHRRPPLSYLGQLFNQVDSVILETYQELDAFGPRKEHRRYWGHWPADGGLDVVWPASKGPKVFAYIKAFPAVHAILHALERAGVPSLIVAGELAAGLRQRHPSSTLRFEESPVDLSKVAKQCDLAITNAGHGALATMLLAGKPMLLFPLHMEQLFNAQAVTKLGAGLRLRSDNVSQVEPTLHQMLSTNRFEEGAQSFAKRYADFTPGQQIPELVDVLENLLPPATPKRSRPS